MLTRQGLQASAISLLFALCEAPSAQPRAFLAAHIIGALIGVGMSKLSRSLSDDDRFLWLTASLSCAITVVLMQLMNTVHAPGGMCVCPCPKNNELNNVFF